jgi:hypothetical protein
MPRYTPGAIPDDAPRGLKAWLANELRSIAAAMLEAEGVRLPVLGAEPERRVNGMIVYADGSSWDPGAGAGFYGYESGAWVKL